MVDRSIPPWLTKAIARFAPLLIVALALAVTCGLWSRFDLETADPAYYYNVAREYRVSGKFASEGHLVFSPLYTAFLAWVQRVTADPYEVLVLHRVLIVIWCALAVFGVFRRLLPLRWAWLGVVWWLCLPVNWRAQFEVHLFGFALLATGAWLAGKGRHPLFRGLALTAFALCGLMVRNEFLLAAGLFAGFMAWELWRGRAEGGPAVLVRAGWGLLPVILVLGLIAGSQYRTLEKVERKKITEAFALRQKLNFSQVYAFGVKQRDASWQGDPWVGGDVVVARDFGRSGIGFGEALKANPTALMGHAMWNVRLLPDGIALALFGQYHGAHAPDFANDRGGHLPALLGVLVVFAICGAGAWQYRGAPPPAWQKPAARWTWVGLWCCVPSCIVAVLTQRPRPSYFFIASLLLMAWTLVCLARWFEQSRWARAGASLLGAGAAGWLLLGAVLAPPKPLPRPITEDYHRLAPYAELLQTKALSFHADVPYADELMCYLYQGPKRKPAAKTVQAENVEKLLSGNEPVLIYLRRPEAFPPEMQAAWARGGTDAWHRIAGGDLGKSPWVLLCNTPFQVAAGLPPPPAKP